MNTPLTVDFSQVNLKVTYDATLQGLTQENPQVNFKYFTNQDQSESQILGIRLPTEKSKSIKWGFEDTELLKEADENLLARETWTFEIDDAGLMSLTSPGGNKYTKNYGEVLTYTGRTSLETRFADFLTDGRSCYEILESNPSKS